jgi:hypothetical protein
MRVYNAFKQTCFIGWGFRRSQEVWDVKADQIVLVLCLNSLSVKKYLLLNLSGKEFYEYSFLIEWIKLLQRNTFINEDLHNVILFGSTASYMISSSKTINRKEPMNGKLFSKCRFFLGIVNKIFYACFTIQFQVRRHFFNEKEITNKLTLLKQST